MVARGLARYQRPPANKVLQQTSRVLRNRTTDIDLRALISASAAPTVPTRATSSKQRKLQEGLRSGVIPSAVLNQPARRRSGRTVKETFPQKDRNQLEAAAAAYLRQGGA